MQNNFVLDEVVDSQKSALKSAKFLYHGHLYIRRGNNLYNATGARVK